MGPLKENNAKAALPECGMKNKDLKLGKVWHPLRCSLALN